jgi:hypothetical protein
MSCQGFYKAICVICCIAELHSASGSKFDGDDNSHAVQIENLRRAKILEAPNPIPPAITQLLGPVSIVTKEGVKVLP